MRSRSRGLALACVVMGVVAIGCTPPTAGTTDTSPPRVVSTTTNPTSASPGATVTLSSSLTDDSGTSTVLFQVFRNPPIECLGGNLATRTSGVATDGVWSRTCTLPAVLVSGDYVVAPLAQDVKGNISTLGVGPQATLTITGGVADADPPLVTALTATPTSVARGATVVLSAHVTDATGTAELAFLTANPTSVLACAAGNTATRTAGTATDGTWTVNCMVPSNTPVGVYQVTPFGRDLVNNLLTITLAPSITLTVT